MSLHLPDRAPQPAPQVTVHATCTSCGQDAALTETNRDAALNLLDALGWWDLDTTPLCPNCAAGPPTQAVA